jgi:uncharacterized membrane protein YdjX (TVP38/TMEM64 family)
MWGDSKTPSGGRHGLKRGILLRGVVVILSVAAVVEFLYQSDMAYGPDDLKVWVDREILGHGAAGMLLFVAFGAVFTGIGLSRQVLAFVAGYAFGIAAGTGLALAGEVGGVILAFFYARFLGRGFVTRKFPRRVRQVDDFLKANPFLMTLAVRLLPVSNNLAVNLVAGVSSVPLIPFFVASAIGHTPQTVVFAMIGSGLTDGLMMKSALAVGLFVLSVWIGVYLYREYRRGKAFDPEIDAALDDPADVEVAETPSRPRPQ